MASDISLEQDGVVWCPSCGIPHEAGATHCTFCSRPLAASLAGEPASPEIDGDASAATPPPDPLLPDARTGVLARAVAERVAARRSPRPARDARWPMSRRPPTLTDEEIEARAAAIVAQACEAEAAGVALSSPTVGGGPGPLPDAEPFSQLEFLPPLRQSDRQWLLAGFVCCGLLILFAIAFVRFLAG